jgi:hypothetical protein
MVSLLGRFDWIELAMIARKFLLSRSPRLSNFL